MNILNWLLDLDKALLTFINRDLSHPLLDVFFKFITNLHHNIYFSFLFLPMVIFIFIFKFRSSALRCILLLALLVGLCDFFNHNFLKPLIGRDRPFRNSEVIVDLKIGRSGGLSLPSNHATNTMAGAVFIGLYYPPAMIPSILVSIVVGFSRPYLGVHFPFDVVLGWLFGATAAILFVKFISRRFVMWSPSAMRWNQR